MIGSIISSKLATLYELDTVYGLEDLFNLYEIVIIRVANEQKAMEKAKERRKKR